MKIGGDPSYRCDTQRGAALLVLLVIISVAALYLFTDRLSVAQVRDERERKTADALSQAKQALVGRAAIDINRPGSLPCPDTNGDGSAQGFVGNDCPSYIGWLPWKTLGLPDLRDADGERLWYVLSNTLRDDGSAEPINSDTPMSVTLDGNADMAAVIIAPGAPLPGQNGRPSNAVPDYLDGENSNGDMVFVSGPKTDSFNDRVLGITRDDIFRVVEARVAREAFNCLNAYAAANQGRFPWAAPLNPAAPPSYDDVTNARFGRIPDNFEQTEEDSDGAMSKQWPSSCVGGPQAAWWSNNKWNEMVFFAVANAYKPVPTPIPPASCGACLSVTPPSVTANTRLVVLVAGRTLSGFAGVQQRGSNSDKGNIRNYLELENADGDDLFASRNRSQAFNDTVLFE